MLFTCSRYINVNSIYILRSFSFDFSIFIFYFKILVLVFLFFLNFILEVKLSFQGTTSVAGMYTYYWNFQVPLLNQPKNDSFLLYDFTSHSARLESPIVALKNISRTRGIAQRMRRWIGFNFPKQK
jgi:hypothetical protein